MTNKHGFCCIFCGAELIWGSDNLCNEICDDYEDDDYAVVSTFTCPKCGRFYEIWQPPKCERENEYNDFYQEKDINEK